MAYQILDSTEDTGRDDDRLANYTDGNDGNCYKVYTNHSNYHDASNQCKSDGGMLVSIHSKEKNNFIKHMAEKAGSLVWLGLKCEHFYWSPICKWSDNGPSTYTEFFEGRQAAYTFFKIEKLKYFQIFHLIKVGKERNAAVIYRFQRLSFSAY
ncbi:lectin C-type domain protein [Oesophagostomum dentatum]|uniref:Lectin C-type domain protein n=1 Tax=Oesophagostomum dentatum TaxID=61180 RepID=A0A0B1T433_OESDE|nr:lectin C-type domain protein [Oesophagostomum dentatum]